MRVKLALSKRVRTNPSACANKATAISSVAAPPKETRLLARFNKRFIRLPVYRFRGRVGTYFYRVNKLYSKICKIYARC